MTFRVCGAVLGGLLWLGVPRPAGAVVTYDLLHDTPRTRELLREELGASALTRGETSATTSPAASRGAFETIWFGRERYLQIGEADRAEQ